MAQTILTLDYINNDWSNQYLHQFAININGVEYYTSFIYRVVNTPTQPFDVAKGVTTTETVTNIKTRLDNIVSSLALGSQITVQQTATKIEIFIGQDADTTFACFYSLASQPSSAILTNCYIGGGYPQANIDIRYATPVVPDAPIGTTPVSGLESSGYLINNDIYITCPPYLSLTGADRTTYYSLTFKNLETQKLSNPIEVYPILGKGVKLNISPIIKSMFTYPQASNDYTSLTPFVLGSNYHNFEIVINRYHTTDASTVEVYESVILTRAFIRGGERTNNSNLTKSIGEVLRPTEVLPVWAGYPTAEYKIAAGFTIKQNNNLSTVIDREQLDVKGCDPVYIRFLNQQGAYSTWLFEGATDSQGGNDLGYANNLGEVIDLGKEFSSETTLYSKIPFKWAALIQDLLISPEVYIYTGANTWGRITLGANKIETNNYKKVIETKIKYENITNFNPSLVW
jgi:hypothetical protein